MVKLDIINCLDCFDSFVIDYQASDNSGFDKLIDVLRLEDKTADEYCAVLEVKSYRL